MPRLIDYDDFVRAADQAQMRILYPNGGALGFISQHPIHIRGLMCKPDPTIHPNLLGRCVIVESTQEIARLGDEACAPSTHTLLMPATHWSHEIDAHGKWMIDSFNKVGIDITSLTRVARAVPVRFEQTESDQLRFILHELLDNLEESDFILWPVDIARVGTIHHHRQLWWQSLEPI